MMRAAVMRGVRAMEIVSVPVPEPSDRQILIKTALCGLCGSDWAAFHGFGRRSYPYFPGHEFWGAVVKKGGAVPGFPEGDAVLIDPNLGCGECRYCRGGRPNLCDNLKTRQTKSNGGFCEFVAVDFRMAYPKPTALTGSNAVFVEPLSCAVHAVDRMGMGDQGTVAIFGAGCTGMLTGLVLRSRGLHGVFVEPREGRRETARSILGMEAVAPGDFDAQYGPQSFDFALDCSGSPQAVGQAVGCLKKGGRLCLSGISEGDGENGLHLAEITIRELELIGTWLNPASFPDAISIAVESSGLLERFPIAFIGMDGLVGAFEKGVNPCVTKTILRF